MKNFILILFSLFFTLNVSCQTTVDCYTCEAEKKFDCDGCGIKTGFFTGLIVRTPKTKDIALHHPIKITNEGSLIFFEDAFGTKINVSINRLKGFSTVSSFYDYLRDCLCNSSTGDYYTSKMVMENGELCWTISDRDTGQDIITNCTAAVAEVQPDSVYSILNNSAFVHVSNNGTKDTIYSCTAVDKTLFVRKFDNPAAANSNAAPELPCRAFASPQAAAKYAGENGLNGWTIRVFPGTYRLTNAGSGGDYESIPQNYDPNFNLVRADSLTYTFDTGAKIVCEIDGFESALFDFNSNTGNQVFVYGGSFERRFIPDQINRARFVRCNIVGEKLFRLQGSSMDGHSWWQDLSNSDSLTLIERWEEVYAGSFTSMFAQDAKNLTVYFYADEYNFGIQRGGLQTPDAAWSVAMFRERLLAATPSNHKIHFEINNLNAKNDGQALFGFDTNNSDYYLKLNNVDSKFSDGFLPNQYSKDPFLADFQTYQLPGGSGHNNISPIFAYSARLGRADSTSIVLDLGKVKSQGDIVDGRGGSPTNTNIEIYCKYCETESTIARIRNNSRENFSMSFYGNYVSKFNSFALDNSSNFLLNLDGNFKSESGNFLTLRRSTNSFINLNDSKILGNSTNYPVIQVDGATYDVISLDAYSNMMTVDPQITYIIKPLIRDIRIK